MVHIVTRAEWSAQYSRGAATSGAKVRVVVHHDSSDRSSPAMSAEREIALMRFLEDYHVNHRPERFDGIGYSFVIMQSGRIYEGRGWGRVGAHTHGLNSSAYGVCFPINGMRTAPSPAAVKSFHDLRMAGIRLGHLAANHLVSGHRDHGSTSCPGDRLYDALVRHVEPPEHAPTVRQVVDAKPTLRLGKGGPGADSGEQAAVRVLQRRLFEMQELRHQDITGYFGERTAAAVARIQRKYRLNVDSIVGPNTYKVLGI